MCCALALTVLHAALLLGAAGSRGGPPGHGHGTAALPAAGDGGQAAMELLAIVALEITTALLAATLLARLRRRLTGLSGTEVRQARPPGRLPSDK
jgi:hypothetical protein